jgi:2-keto-4-pentenoate hydratase/2-oxohepta-3-ene-1,7-dioic acid hydratase in catechol pathway
VGNDISSRKLQRDPALAGRVPQWGFSKGFDTFAPIGPCLLASSEVPDPSQLRLTTTINGEQRQSESISDLCFDCACLVSYLSQGTTLQKGSIIMTGTPGGKSPHVECHAYLMRHHRRGRWLQSATLLDSGDKHGGARDGHWNTEKWSSFCVAVGTSQLQDSCSNTSASNP